MKHVIISALVSFTASNAFAGGEHDHSHSHEDAGGNMEMMAVGMAGSSEQVDRTFDVIMRETDDGSMIFEPETFQIVQGETIRFSVTNKGKLEHEFVIDTVEGNAEHKAMMAKMDMEHDDPNSVRLDPGQSGEVIWTFANEGAFEFACLIPGHYEAGMHGPIDVSATATELAYTSGVVKKVNADAGKVTIIHEELTELDMPAMTMVFRAEEDIISRLSEGEEIEFAAKRVNGKLTVTAVR